MSVCPQECWRATSRRRGWDRGAPRAGSLGGPWCHGGHQATARVEASVDGTMTMSRAPTYRTEPRRTLTANPDEPGCDDGKAPGALTHACRRPPAHQGTTPGLTQTVIPQLQSALAAQHGARFGQPRTRQVAHSRILTNGPLSDTTV